MSDERATRGSPGSPDHPASVPVPVPDVIAATSDVGELPPAQGWYVDPVGDYTERWFSGGAPTPLVRDESHLEAEDEPSADAEVPAVVDLVPAPEQQAEFGADLARADRATSLDQKSPAVAAQETLDASGLWSAAGD